MLNIFSYTYRSFVWYVFIREGCVQKKFFFQTVSFKQCYFYQSLSSLNCKGSVCLGMKFRYISIYIHIKYCIYYLYIIYIHIYVSACIFYQFVNSWYLLKNKIKKKSLLKFYLILNLIYRTILERIKIPSLLSLLT